MNFSIITPDAFGRVDPPLMRLLQCLPRGDDIAIVPITRLDEFRFREDLSRHIGKKPWVLCCMSEFGWDWNQESSYLWGRDRTASQRFQYPEWKRFEDWITDNPPVLTFQRELLVTDASDRVLPIEYLNYSNPIRPDTEEQFNARPIDVMFNWGLSSRIRPVIHGDIFMQSMRLGYEVCSQWDHLERETRDKRGIWASIHTPHYARLNNEEMIRWFGRSKIVVAAPGDGVKNFRQGEINNSAIAMIPDKLAYSIPIKGVRLNRDAFAESLWQFLHGEDSRFLYEVYLMNNAASDKLRPERYIPEYLIPKIQEKL